MLGIMTIYIKYNKIWYDTDTSRICVVEGIMSFDNSWEPKDTQCSKSTCKFWNPNPKPQTQTLNKSQAIMQTGNT